MPTSSADRDERPIPALTRMIFGVCVSLRNLANAESSEVVQLCQFLQVDKSQLRFPKYEMDCLSPYSCLALFPYFRLLQPWGYTQQAPPEEPDHTRMHEAAENVRCVRLEWPRTRASVFLRTLSFLI